MLVTLKNLLQILENLEQGLAEDGSMTNITQENRQGRYSLNVFSQAVCFYRLPKYARSFHKTAPELLKQYFCNLIAYSASEIIHLVLLFDGINFTVLPLIKLMH